MIEKDRLMALTDGIIAVAATILVLQLQVPDEISWEAIGKQAPIVFAALISFMQIFLAWHEHHDACADARFFNHRLMFVNALWLFCITILPFATELVGLHPDDRRAILIYCALLMIINIIIKIECTMIEKLNRISMRDQFYIHKLQRLSVIGISIAVAASFIKPFASLIIIIAMNIISIAYICKYDVNSTKKNLVKLGIADASEFEEQK